MKGNYMTTLTGITTINNTLPFTLLPSPPTKPLINFADKINELNLLNNLSNGTLKDKITDFSLSADFLKLLSNPLEALKTSLCTGTPALIAGGVLLLLLATGPIGDAIFLGGIILTALVVGALATVYFAHDIFTKQTSFVEKSHKELQTLLLSNKDTLTTSLNTLIAEASKQVEDLQKLTAQTAKQKPNPALNELRKTAADLLTLQNAMKLLQQLE